MLVEASPFMLFDSLLAMYWTPWLPESEITQVYYHYPKFPELYICCINFADNNCTH